MPENFPVPPVIGPTNVEVTLPDWSLWLTREYRVKTLSPPLHRECVIAGVGPIAIGIVGDGVGNLFNELQPIDHRRVVWMGTMKLKKQKLMPRHVSYVECVPLREFGIFNRNLEGNMLFLLRDRIMRWHGNRQGQQCYGRERGALIHDFLPSGNCAAEIGNRCHPAQPKHFR
jgi:hypothetical protein